jgi:hypothetical protein
VSEDTRAAAPSGTTSFAQVDSEGIVLRSEFAYVRVRLRDPGGRPRLRVEDLRTGQTIELDAIELESLAWAHHRDLTPLLDPSLTRWASEDDEFYLPPKYLDQKVNYDSDFTDAEMDLSGVRRHLRPHPR